jgi:hypothetical protein
MNDSDKDIVAKVKEAINAAGFEHGGQDKLDGMTLGHMPPGIPGGCFLFGLFGGAEAQAYYIGEIRQRNQVLYELHVFGEDYLPPLRQLATDLSHETGYLFEVIKKQDKPIDGKVF